VAVSLSVASLIARLPIAELGLHYVLGIQSSTLPSAPARLRPVHRDHKLTQPREPEWLLIEWPRGQTEPRKYWM